MLVPSPAPGAEQNHKCIQLDLHITAEHLFDTQVKIHTYLQREIELTLLLVLLCFSVERTEMSWSNTHQ